MKAMFGNPVTQLALTLIGVWGLVYIVQQTMSAQNISPPDRYMSAAEVERFNALPIERTNAHRWSSGQPSATNSAGPRIGDQVEYDFVVMNAYIPGKARSVLLLNNNSDYTDPSAVTVCIHLSKWGKLFPPAQTGEKGEGCVGLKIRGQGKWSSYKGRPQIIPSSLEVGR